MWVGLGRDDGGGVVAKEHRGSIKGDWAKRQTVDAPRDNGISSVSIVPATPRFGSGAAGGLSAATGSPDLVAPVCGSPTVCISIGAPAGCVDVLKRPLVRSRPLPVRVSFRICDELPQMRPEQG